MWFKPSPANGDQGKKTRKAVKMHKVWLGILSTRDLGTRFQAYSKPARWSIESKSGINNRESGASQNKGDTSNNRGKRLCSQESNGQWMEIHGEKRQDYALNVTRNMCRGISAKNVLFSREKETRTTHEFADSE